MSAPVANALGGPKKTSPWHVDAVATVEHVEFERSNAIVPELLQLFDP
jgi:hypothetical protein